VYRPAQHADPRTLELQNNYLIFEGGHTQSEALGTEALQKNPRLPNLNLLQRSIKDMIDEMESPAKGIREDA
jgi:hypothetical protein